MRFWQKLCTKINSQNAILYSVCHGGKSCGNQKQLSQSTSQCCSFQHWLSANWYPRDSHDTNCYDFVHVCAWNLLVHGIHNIIVIKEVPTHPSKYGIFSSHLLHTLDELIPIITVERYKDILYEHTWSVYIISVDVTNSNSVYYKNKPVSKQLVYAQCWRSQKAQRWKEWCTV